MRVLIVNAHNIQGGAARAAYRLHRSLLAAGVDSIMFVQNKSGDDFTVIGPITKRQKVLAKVREALDSAPLRLYSKRTPSHYSISWFPSISIVNKINQLNADIVHLHWINNGMLRVEDLLKIKAPIVWSLHDNWAFTGGCHVKWECEEYKNKCGNCPRLGSNKENDLSRWIWKRKKKVFDKLENLVIVGLSNWVMNCSKESSLLKDKEHINLPNPIDTNIFKPVEKTKAKELWNLPKDKKLILFGAMSATSDINKGFKELSEGLSNLRDEHLEFVVFGSSRPQNAPDFRFKAHYVGMLHDDISLVALYNAVDLMIVPSLQENLSNVIMESLACGTPVVAFDIGGNSDMIEHKKNGYLVKPFETTDLANGIKWVINSPNYDRLCQAAREKVLNRFSQDVVAEQYIDLYKMLLRE